MHCELVRTQTSDSVRLDGALFEPAAESHGRIAADAAICLHGVGANFYTSSTLEGVRPVLLELGLRVLSVNTRGHDTAYLGSMAMGRRRMGAAFETVDDCRYDIAAWLKFAAARELRRIVLVGHSLGAIKAVYAQAIEQFEAVRGVVAISPPRLSHRAFMASLESSVYFESLSQAQELVKAGTPQQLFEAKFPFPMLITAAGYIEKYGPAERYNVLNFAGQLNRPALFAYGSKELAGPPSFAGMPEALQQLPSPAPRDVVTIADGDHNYTGVVSELGTEIGRWLKNRLRAS